MKTYILDLPNRIKIFKEILDAKVTLCNKSWRVLNDEGVYETYFFKNDGKIIISRDGMAQIGTFEILPIGKILISVGSSNYIVRPVAAGNDDLISFQLDGTSQCSFLLNEAAPLGKQISSFSQLKMYFNKIAEIEMQKQIEEANREAKAAAEAEEKQRREKAEEEKEEYFHSLALGYMRRPYKLRFSILLVCIIAFDLFSTVMCIKFDWSGLWIFLALALIACLPFAWLEFVKKSDASMIRSILEKKDVSETERQWLIEKYATLESLG